MDLLTKIAIDDKEIRPLEEIVKLLIPLHGTKNDNRKVIIKTTPIWPDDNVIFFCRLSFDSSRVYEYDITIFKNYDITIDRYYLTAQTTTHLILKNRFKVYMQLISWGFIDDLHLHFLDVK